MLKDFLTYSDLYITHLENGNKWFLQSVLMTKWDIACKTQSIKITYSVVSDSLQSHGL